MSSSRLHYWIVSQVTERNGAVRPVLIYGATSEQEARMKGMETLPGVDFRIYPFRTADLHKASALLRGKTLNDTHDLRGAMTRQTHEKGLEQRQERQRNKYGRTL